MTDANTVCSNPECLVATTGNCFLEHDPLDSCPNFDASEPVELDPGEEEDEKVEPSASVVDGISLRPNKLISEKEIPSFRNRTRAQTVVLVGEQKAGKTTLLAALYGLFCKGPVGKYEFVSSQTLYSFAERNHLAMFSPARLAPGTPRTSRGDDVNFFHLKIRAGEDVSDILISDRSGEAFEDARVDTSLVERLTELALADRICFLLDAARLTKLETRAGYRRIFKQTIRALVDNGAIPKSAILEVLVTKLDRVSSKQGDTDLIQEVEAYTQQLIQEFGERGFEFGVYQVCALPRANVALGFVGLEELVARWASVPADADIAPKPLENALRQIDRMPKLWS